MSAYEVKLADGPNSGFDDIKELPRDVRQELLAVMRTELRIRADLDPKALDEAPLDEPPWLFRRGVRRAHRKTLDQQRYEATTSPQAYDYCIVYRPFDPSEVQEFQGQPGFYVWRVLSNPAMANLYLGYREALDRSPPTPGPC